MKKESICSMLNYFYGKLNDYLRHDSDALIHDYGLNVFRQQYFHNEKTDLEKTYILLRELLNSKNVELIKWSEINGIFEMAKETISSIRLDMGDSIFDFRFNMLKRYAEIEEFIQNLHIELLNVEIELLRNNEENNK